MNKVIDVSFVIPCLNEEKTIELVINEIHESFKSSRFSFEIVVSDNNSTDKSRIFAERAGARVVLCKEKGYGAALRFGFHNALGRFIVMGDADGSYKFADSLKMLSKLEAGADFVIGNRFAGKIEQKAMPWLHRYIGNPILSFLGRLFFRVKIKDFHCGLRAFRKNSLSNLNFKCDGMEFASEQIVLVARHHLIIEEEPINLHKDLRDRPPHLNTWRDGWRHLRYLFSQAPNWLFVTPILVSLLFSLIFLYIFSINPIKVQQVEFSYGTGILFLIFSIITQIIFWILNISNLILFNRSLFNNFSFEKLIVIPLLFLIAGTLIIFFVFANWSTSGFGDLPQDVTLAQMIVALFLISTGVISLSFIALQSLIKSNVSS